MVMGNNHTTHFKPIIGHTCRLAKIEYFQVAWVYPLNKLMIYILTDVALRAQLNIVYNINNWRIINRKGLTQI